MSESENDLAQYASVMSSLKVLEEQRDAIKTRIVERMTKDGTDLVPTVFGEFKLQGRKTWMYTQAVTRREEDLKVLKFEEEQKGIASFVEKKSLYFIPTKI